MIRSRHRDGALAALLLLLTASGARADAAADRAAGEALFFEARTLVDKGNHAEGCPKFEASFALLPSASTMIHIGKCHEHAGKTASARAAYQRALEINRETVGAERKKALEELARKAADALAQRVPTLTIVVSPAPAGLHIFRGDLELPAEASGSALPTDPGPHVIVVRAPGYVEERREIVLDEGEKETLTFTLREAPNAAPTAPAEPARTVMEPPAPPPDPPEPAAGEAEIPVWAWPVGGAGIALIGVGFGFLADDLAAISALRDGCPETAGVTICEGDYDPADDNARQDRSFGLFVGLTAGGAAALTAALVGIGVGLSSAPSEPAPRVTLLPAVSGDGAGLTAMGAF